MNQDPYQPPNSELDNNHHPQRPSVAWRILFGINCLFAILTVLSIPFVDSIGIIEVVDFTFSNVALVGLYGFVFCKPIGDVAFWRYFFYAAIGETFVVFLIYPLFGLPIYGRPLPIDVWYLIGLVDMFFTLMALNLYAYKIRGLWKS